MKKIKILLVSLTVLTVTNSFAQSDDKKAATGTSFSVGVEAGLPVGKDFKDIWNFGIGGSAKAAINVFDGGDVTISAGYISFMGKSVKTITGVDQNLNPVYGNVKAKALGTIPLKAGLRFKISEGFYGEPQLGYTIAKVSGEDGNLNGFTYAANLGYMINKMIDISARYEAFTKSESGQTFTGSFIGLRVAYSFGL